VPGSAREGAEGAACEAGAEAGGFGAGATVASVVLPWRDE